MAEIFRWRQWKDRNRNKTEGWDLDVGRYGGSLDDSIRKKLLKLKPLPGDWLIKQGFKTTLLSKGEIRDKATIYEAEGGTNRLLYNRGKRYHIPEYVKEALHEGDILIDNRQKHDEENFLLLGSESRTLIKLEVDSALVLQNENSLSPGLSAPSVPANLGQLVYNESRAIDFTGQLAENVSLLGRDIEELAGLRKAVDRARTKEERENAYEQFAKKILWIYEEAVPSPTPGTTAVFDFPKMGLEMTKLSREMNDRELGQPGENSIVMLDHLSTTLGGLGTCVQYLTQLKKISDSINKTNTRTGKRQADGEANTAAMTAILASPKMISQFFSVANNVVQATEKTGQFVTAMGTVASKGMPVVGAIVGAVTTARVTRKMGKAAGRYKKLKSYHDYNQHRSAELVGILQYAVAKTNRKVKVAGSTALTGAVGTAGSGILASAAIFTTANMWNPVGWSLVGMAAVGGTGVITYKVYRRATRSTRRKNNEKRNIPKNTKDMALKLLRIAGDKEHRDQDIAVAVLEIYGVVKEDIVDENINNPDFIDTVVELLKRKNEHV